MDEAELGELRGLLPQARGEVEELGTLYGRLGVQLEELQQALQSGEPNDELIEATRRTFLQFPGLIPIATKGGLDPTEGSTEASALVEIWQIVVTAAKKGEEPRA